MLSSVLILAVPGRVAAGRIAPYLGVDGALHKWPGGTVAWVYDPAGAPAVFADEGRTVAVLQRAFSEWSGVADLSFDFRGVDRSRDRDDMVDGVVVVGWGNLTATGVTQIFWSSSRRTELGYDPIEDGWVLFDLRYGWDRGDPGLTESSLFGVAVHEIGHLIGLGHSNVPRSVMYANPYNHLQYPRWDDVEAARALYGPAVAPRCPSPYEPPAGQDTTSLARTWLAFDTALRTPISELSSGSEAGLVYVVAEIPGGTDLGVQVVWADPDGFFYTGQGESLSCGDDYLACTVWMAPLPVASVATVPGAWTATVHTDHGVAASLPIRVASDRTWNHSPDGRFVVSPTSGPGPLAVDLRVEVSGDPEGHDVMVVWNVPGEGESRQDLGGAQGVATRTVTFPEPGRYEVFAHLVDDGPRYGASPGGDDAGSGFQRLFRQVVEVYDGGWTVEGTVSGPRREAFGYARCGGRIHGPAPVGPDGVFRLGVPGATAVCERVWVEAWGCETAVVANVTPDDGGKAAVVFSPEELLVDRSGYGPAEPGGVVTLPANPDRLENGFRVRLASDDGEAVELRAPPGGDGTFAWLGPEARLRVRSVAASGSGLSPGTGGVLTELAVEPVPEPDGLVSALEVALPFDVDTVPAMALEAGAWAVFVADDPAAYARGEREEVQLVLGADRADGLARFRTERTGVFGIEPVERMDTGVQLEGGGAATEPSDGAAGGGGCFLETLWGRPGGGPGVSPARKAGSRPAG